MIIHGNTAVLTIELFIPSGMKPPHSGTDPLAVYTLITDNRLKDMHSIINCRYVVILLIFQIFKTSSNN